ncbi:hypothetical protein, partial [Anabaena sp. UHCC 0451]|uniref:hypothetical protein n=1 Tax=Anabaena sp. UHCC 0451 TaxID=2055235 RepID=UPI002B213F2C
VTYIPEPVITIDDISFNPLIKVKRGSPVRVTVILKKSVTRSVDITLTSDDKYFNQVLKKVKITVPVGKNTGNSTFIVPTQGNNYNNGGRVQITASYNNSSLSKCLYLEPEPDQQGGTNVNCPPPPSEPISPAFILKPIISDWIRKNPELIISPQSPSQSK